ncbi:MAG: biopolymer transporter ExbD [Bacteroidia bacterium]|jgi:biopolymer transport protein ExbD|nr:biopolymer transporter ExbD [Bacteroidota bacterium]MBP6511071.1 biopolymer transporter ExbD [Bacteroidia bacterium]MBP7243801.1 biopolymer transporter ExbD [Bacteroidia bacterium]
MADVQTNDQDSGKGGKHKKVRAKKQSTHIDMTPMVDLAFLLLTFFMMTTTFGKPKTMEINMPVKPDTPENQTLVNNAVTILLTGDDKIYWYFGELKPETKLELTNYSNDGLRKLFLDKNKFAVDRIKQLRTESATNNMADSTLKRLEVEAKGAKQALMVLVKADDKAKYKNIVDVLDELNITMVGKYAIVDLAQQEFELINTFKPQP